MNELEQKIMDQTIADHDYVVGLRRYFHEHPEIAKEEFNTQKRIEEELDKLGIPHKRIAGTGVYAEIRGNLPGKRTIVLRADIDALPEQEEHDCPYKSQIPNRMHACGHDAHDAALIGAARILNANKDLFGGTIRFTWQPGEEIGYGARVIVDEGDLDGADRTFGEHLASDVTAGDIAITPGPNNASVDWFRITVHGKAAHVSVPHRGIDALYIASQIVVAIQALITRRTSPMDNVLVGIGKFTSGDAYNIVAAEAKLEGTIRVFKPEIRKQVKADIERLSTNIAESYGGTVSFEWNDNTSPLINDEKAAAEAQKTAIGLFGSEHVITNRAPALGGDDFAEYILKVPGVYAYVGSGNDSRPETRVAHHDTHFDIDEDCLRVGVAMYAAYAIEYLNGTLD